MPNQLPRFRIVATLGDLTDFCIFSHDFRENTGPYEFPFFRRKPR